MLVDMHIHTLLLAVTHIEASGFLGTVGKIAAATIVFFLAVGFIVGLVLGIIIGRLTARR